MTPAHARPSATPMTAGPSGEVLGQVTVHDPRRRRRPGPGALGTGRRPGARRAPTGLGVQEADFPRIVEVAVASPYANPGW